jgi:hypothetical protein
MAGSPTAPAAPDRAPARRRVDGLIATVVVPIRRLERRGGVVRQTARHRDLGVRGRPVREAAREAAAAPRDVCNGRGVGVLAIEIAVVPWRVTRAAPIAAPRPGRRRSPVAWRVALRLACVALRIERARRVGSRARCLTPCPVLEGWADRERGGEAVRLLVGKRPWGGLRLGVAAVTMIRTGRSLVAIVLEGDERTRRCAVGDGEPSLGHRRRSYPRVTPAAGAWGATGTAISLPRARRQQRTRCQRPVRSRSAPPQATHRGASTAPARCPQSRRTTPSCRRTA